MEYLYRTSRQVGGKLIWLKMNPNLGWIISIATCVQLEHKFGSWNCPHFWGSAYSHRRSGKVPARKLNRTAFFGQLSGWLFFCCSERSNCIAPSADGTEPSWKYIYRRTHYRPMTQNHHRHVYGTGRSSLWGSSFSYRTACREVNPNDPINNRKEDYKHDRSSIQQHRYTAHIQRILEERRTAPTVCTSHNVLETRCTASRSR